jgi:hypothetical protein
VSFLFEFSDENISADNDSKANGPDAEVMPEVRQQCRIKSEYFHNRPKQWEKKENDEGYDEDGFGAHKCIALI